MINTDLVNNLRYFNKGNIFFVTSKTWDASLEETTDISSIGNIMYSSFLMWLVITGIILLLAMLGAIIITIKQKQ
jgi:NADH-ubiquinone oxidoreductase chain 6